MPTETMLAPGAYRFSLSTAAYQQFARTARYRWMANNGVGSEPTQQYIGPGEQTVQLSGVIYPHYKGGFRQLALMRFEADRGQALFLVSGSGDVLGRWAIKEVQEKRTVFQPNGLPMKIEFDLTLVRVREPLLNRLARVFADQIGL